MRYILNHRRSNSSSAVVTISVGPSQRLFAAHENVLCQSDFFADALRKQFFEPGNKRIDLPNEEPEIFSAVLEFMYRGDYRPKLAFNEKRGSWSLEEGAKLPSVASESTIFLPDTERTVLKDTVIYVRSCPKPDTHLTSMILTCGHQCSAHIYRLPALQRIALKKQGLQCNVGCSTILASARYAYLHTPANDSKLRAHYLALIIRSRHTFKRSGTMQTEMQEGGSPLFFDLFVALVNHLVSLPLLF